MFSIWGLPVRPRVIQQCGIRVTHRAADNPYCQPRQLLDSAEELLAESSTTGSLRGSPKASLVCGVRQHGIRSAAEVELATSRDEHPHNGRRLGSHRDKQKPFSLWVKRSRAAIYLTTLSSFRRRSRRKYWKTILRRMQLRPRSRTSVIYQPFWTGKASPDQARLDSNLTLHMAKMDKFDRYRRIKGM